MTDDPQRYRREDLTCAEAIDRVYEFLDGELTDEVADAIRVHLEMCSECEPRFEHERVFLELMERVRVEQAPPELRRRLLCALMEEESRRRQA
jgi:anti-sigma factor (TIGR02949 family)